MSRKVDLREIERKTYLAYFQDGLWDILIGLFLLNFGFDMLLGMSSSSILIVSFALVGGGQRGT